MTMNIRSEKSWTRSSVVGDGDNDDDDDDDGNADGDKWLLVLLEVNNVF